MFYRKLQYSTGLTITNMTVQLSSAWSSRCYLYLKYNRLRIILGFVSDTSVVNWL
uniref:Uncharacterized protein n=1 Tax=Anguilla anguilla TaxID=7936 RepID=A0A0E9X2I1_ANGAN